ncbi:MAG: nuclear transport factor 2 family protein, partial [Oscillospiraceae bacterium]|nr:nuclear transport factor 2 family protein [Oscillospiraceae bacterium]
MTNKEKALALIGTFVSGDLELAKSLLAPAYKQHNLAFGTGADAFVAAVAGLQQAPVKTTVHNVRAFEDGDCVFLQTVYNFAGAGEQVAFDVFHFNADGKIDEHWDNLQNVAAP